MSRSAYDGDATTWSPQGRLFQIEYACEAIKQGSACVGLKSRTHAVVVAHLRTSGELGSPTQKVFRVDDHVGIAVAGLTADARMLTKFLRSECINHKFVYDEPLHGARLVGKVADKSQVTTQKSGRRPYGVGLLVAVVDQAGPHIYETSPSGNAYDFKAQAIGARSQSARTYLEKNLTEFPECERDELILHGVRALRETVRTATDGLTAASVAIGVVGVAGGEENFHLLDLDDVQGFLDEVEDDGAGAGDDAEDADAAAAAGSGGDAEMS